MSQHTHSSDDRRKRQARLVAVGCLGVIIAFFAVVLTLPSDRRTPSTPEDSAGFSSLSDQTVAVSGDVALDPEPTSAAASAGYPVYRHSIVDGGVHSMDDVERVVNADPVVREHYAGIALDKLRVVRVGAARSAYMSYRIGNRVYWTSRKIALKEGETILTDGRTTIRARCGNLVSENPMAPMSSSEPDVTAFDQVAPKTGPAAEQQVAAAAGNAPSGVIAAGEVVPIVPGPSQVAANTAPGDNAFSNGPGNGSGVVMSFGGPGVTGRNAPEGRSSDPSLSSDPGPNGGPGPGDGPNGGHPPGDNNPPNGGNPPGDNTPPNGGNPPGDNNPPNGGNPPGDNTPPNGGNPPGTNPPGGNPPGLEPPDLTPPEFTDPNPPDGPGGPGGPETPPGPGPGPEPGEPPVDVPPSVPVPEPASLMLLGGGLALTAWRARRHQRSKNKDL